MTYDDVLYSWAKKQLTLAKVEHTGIADVEIEAGVTGTGCSCCGEYEPDVDVTIYYTYAGPRGGPRASYVKTEFGPDINKLVKDLVEHALEANVSTP